jgi:peptidyl-prolyl cis-trans isomerase C
MNWFEKILGNAFSNQDYPKEANDRPKASARHILVKTQNEVGIVQEKLAAGGTASFGSVARDFSTCPSGRQGGTLGRFGPGAMVKEFDAVIFDPNTPLGQVVGPVQTQFGYHFIVVDERTGM